MYFKLFSQRINELVKNSMMKIDWAKTGIWIKYTT